jgi:hypothetical protein
VKRKERRKGEDERKEERGERDLLGVLSVVFSWYSPSLT